MHLTTVILILLVLALLLFAAFHPRGRACAVLVALLVIGVTGLWFAYAHVSFASLPDQSYGALLTDQPQQLAECNGLGVLSGDPAEPCVELLPVSAGHCVATGSAGGVAVEGDYYYLRAPEGVEARAVCFSWPWAR